MPIEPSSNSASARFLASPGLREHLAGVDRRVTRLVALFFLGMVVWLIAVDGLVLWWTGVEPLSKDNLVAVTVLVSFLMAATAFQWWRMGRDGGVVARFLGGSPVALDPEDSKLRRLRQVLDEMAIAAAMPAPQLYILAGDRSINAFAAGVDRAHAAIAVSQGAIDRLSRDELQAVVAHELAHVANGDTLISMRLCAVAFGLMALALLGIGLTSLGAQLGRDSDKEVRVVAGAMMIAGFVTAVCGAIGWCLALVIQAATSRDQEFRADAQAVRWMSSTQGMVGVLIKLAQEQRLVPVSAFREEHAGLYRAMFLRDSARPGWFDSHPPLLRRIGVLDPQALVELDWKK